MQVLLHAQMRKKPRFLKHIAKAPFMRGREDAFLPIGQHRAIQFDPPLIRLRQPGNDAHHRGLAGAGAAEKRGHALSAVKAASSVKLPSLWRALKDSVIARPPFC